jgi:UDP-2,3-diacylglucosamine hydrolase
MRAVFLSDAHIVDQDDPRLAPLIAFLRHIAGRVEQLFIVGDLFHTWFGFRHAVFAEYVPLLNALYEVRTAGTEIVYVTGNHDFEMGGYFTDILGAKVYDTEVAMEADGRNAFIAHGDLANRDDKAYRVLRFALRNRVTRWLGRNLPPAWIWHMGQWLQRSCGNNDPRGDRYDPLFRAYADEKFRQGYDTVILAHSHSPVLETGDGGERTYANLGDWITRRTYLCWDEGRLSLKQWAWPEAEERACREAT